MRYLKQKMDQMSTLEGKRSLDSPIGLMMEMKKADKDLSRKHSTEDELSRIINMLVIALRTLLRNGIIFVHEKTIEQEDKDTS